MMGWVYFIAASDLNLVKIGTCRDAPGKRLAALQTGSPALLDLISAIPGDRALEQRLHRAFADLREHGEWFRFEGALARLALDMIEPGDPTARLVKAGVYG